MKQVFLLILLSIIAFEIQAQTKITLRSDKAVPCRKYLNRFYLSEIK
jgi:hypothetical protein